jgi:hypothetical protein
MALAIMVSTRVLRRGVGWLDVWDILRTALEPPGNIRDARCALQRELYFDHATADAMLTVAIGLSPCAPPLTWGDLDCPVAERDEACEAALRNALTDADKLRAAVLALAMEGLPHGA